MEPPRTGPRVLAFAMFGVLLGSVAAGLVETDEIERPADHTLERDTERR